MEKEPLVCSGERDMLCAMTFLLVLAQQNSSLTWIKLDDLWQNVRLSPIALDID